MFVQKTLVHSLGVRQDLLRLCISLPQTTNGRFLAITSTGGLTGNGRLPLLHSIFLHALQDNRCSTRRFLADREDLLIFERVETSIGGFNIRKPD
jgi:hypothetical protein